MKLGELLDVGRTYSTFNPPKSGKVDETAPAETLIYTS